MERKFQNTTPTNRSLKFLPNGPHKTFGIFEILKIEILTIFFFLNFFHFP